MGDYFTAPLKPDMEKADFIEDEIMVEVPSFYYDGSIRSYDDHELPYVWDTDTILMRRGNYVVKYTETSYYEWLFENEDGSTSWIDGRAAFVIDIDEERVIDVRPAKEYIVEDYDVEKSVKRKYKVTLEETSEMDSWDHLQLKTTIGTNNKTTI